METLYEGIQALSETQKDKWATEKRSGKEEKLGLEKQHNRQRHGNQSNCMKQMQTLLQTPWDKQRRKSVF